MEAEVHAAEHPRADPRGGLRPDRRRRHRRRADRPGRDPGRRLHRARSPLLLDPRGAARAGAHPLLRARRRGALRRAARGRRDRHRRARPGDRRVPAPARPAGARVGAVGGAVAARRARAGSAPGRRPALRALPQVDGGADPGRHRERRVSIRTSTSRPSPTWPWRCSTAPGSERCSTTPRWTSRPPAPWSPSAWRAELGIEAGALAASSARSCGTAPAPYGWCPSAPIVGRRGTCFGHRIGVS